MITGAVRELRRRHPDADVSTRHLTWQDTHALPELLVVPMSHRFAGKESVTLDDLADEQFVACTRSPTLWSGPLDTNPGDAFEDKLELVAEGRAIAILPAGDRVPAQPTSAEVFRRVSWRRRTGRLQRSAT